VAGYSKSPDEKIQVAYSVQAFDAKAVPIVELYKNELVAEVAPQDKEWMPKIETEVQIPPLVASGTYKIVVKAEDVLAKTTAELAVPFEVRGHDVEPSGDAGGAHFRSSAARTTPSRSTSRLPPRRRRLGEVRHHRFQVRPNNRVDVS